MKNIYICSTLYQIIVVIQMHTSLFPNYKLDIVLTDSINNITALANRLKQWECCDKVITPDEYGQLFSDIKRCFVPYYLNKRISKVMGSTHPFLQRNTYENVFFANLNCPSIAIATWLKMRNTNAKISMFEDGVASYSYIYRNVVNGTGQNTLYNCLKKKFIYGIYDSLDGYYFFLPELLLWEPHTIVKKIPALEDSKREILPIVNSVFEYKALKDKYSENIIFFEESYYADGIETNDTEIVDLLVSRFGEDNILIKTHPRDRTNRFKQKGLRTNNDKSIPWEVIGLNKTFEGKALVSMTSTAVVNSFLLLNLPSIYVMEYGSLIGMHDNERVKSTVQVIEKIKKVYPGKFLTISEFLEGREEE